MALKNVSKTAGAVHQLDHLESIAGDTDCYALLVSSTTLAMIQAVAENEINYLSRYTRVIQDKGFYAPVLSGTPDAVIAEGFIDLFSVEVFDMGCDLVGAMEQVESAIRAQTLAMISMGLVDGDGDNDIHTPTDPGMEGSPPPTGYKVWDGISGTKCKGIHILIDDTVTAINELATFELDELLLVGLQWVSAQVQMVLRGQEDGPVLWAAMAIEAVAGNVLAWVDTDPVMSDMGTDLLSARTDLACALLPQQDAEVMQDIMAAAMAASPYFWDAGQVDMLRSVATVEAFTAILFQPDSPIGDKYYERMADYSPITDCVCGGSDVAYLEYIDDTFGPSVVALDGVTQYTFTAGNWNHPTRGDYPTMAWLVRCVEDSPFDVNVKIISFSGLPSPATAGGGHVDMVDSTRVWHYTDTGLLPPVAWQDDGWNFRWMLERLIGGTAFEAVLVFDTAVRGNATPCP